MKKIKKKKCIAIILGLVMVIVICKVGPIFIRGYQMYEEAIKEKSITEAVEELQSDEDYVTLNEISPAYIEGVIASEDQRFYKHGAVDLVSIGRAAYRNLKAGYLAEGGSTITQQLAKNMYFSFDKKFERKVAEVFVASELEKLYSKDEILELYCNVAYFGEGCYGLGEATQFYYGVSPAELTENQAKALVWTLKSPNNYNPNVYEGKIVQEDFD